MKMAGPKGPAIFIFRILGTRTREGFSVKKTVQWTVFRKKSLSDSESQLALAESKGGESTTHTVNCVPLHKFHWLKNVR
jgi:hypothetical protein